MRFERVRFVASVQTLVDWLKQNKLPWGGQSETTNRASVDKLVKDTASKVSKELARKSLSANPG